MKNIMIVMVVMLFACGNVYAGDSLVLYKEYLAAVPNAKSIDDVAKYMSREVLMEIKKNPKLGEEILQIIKEAGTTENIKITEEITGEDNVVLKYGIPNKVKSSGKLNPTMVEVSMKRENGLWKIADIKFQLISVI